MEGKQIMKLKPKNKYKLTPQELKIEKLKWKIRISKESKEEAIQQQNTSQHEGIKNNLKWKIKLHDRTINNTINELKQIINDNNLENSCLICQCKMTIDGEYICRKEIELKPDTVKCEEFKSILEV